MYEKYEAFARVAELGSFKQAAEQMGYTQAGIGYLISSLEKELGIALFTRSRTGASLTSDGESLLPWVRDIYNAERVFEEHVAELKHLESGNVRVASFTTININWIPEIVKIFNGQHPNVNLEIFSYENQEEMEEAAWRGEYDVAFVVTKLKHHFDMVKLARDPLYIAVAPDHPLAGKDRFTREDMLNVPYIKVRDSAQTEADDLFERHGVNPEAQLEANATYEVMAFVAQGFGYGVFSKLTLERAPFELCVIEPEIQVPRVISIAVKSKDRASQASRAFVQCVTDWARATQKL